MKIRMIVCVALSIGFGSALAQDKFNVWNSKGNLEDEAHCSAAAMVYLSNYKALPKAYTVSFQNAQQSYGKWITNYNTNATACEREVGNVPLKDLQICITKKMGRGSDYQFGYSYLRYFIGYDKQLKSGRMSKSDLETTLFPCAKP